MSSPRRISAALVAASLLLGMFALAPPGGAQDAPAGTTYIVRFEPGADPDAEAARLGAAGAEVLHVYRHVFPGAAISVSPLRASAVQGLDQVARITPDVPMRSTATQDDPPWGLDRMDQRALPLSSSYTYPATGSGVTAYVVDGGVRPDHLDFDGRVAPGHDVVDPGGDANDCEGHGTHVAGTIGGEVFGAAKDVTVVPVKVLDCNGDGNAAGVIAGLDWIMGHHDEGRPAVANLSLGGNAVTELDLAVERLVADGVSTVVAAGNDDVDACDVSPARAPSAITVGATDMFDRRASFSNFGDCLDVFAPGVDIISALPGSPADSGSMDGTSMAAPHVAGAAAVALSLQPTMTPAAVEAHVIGNATTDTVGDPAGSPNRLLHNPPVPDMVVEGSPVSPGGTLTVSGVACGDGDAVAMVGLLDADSAGEIVAVAVTPDPTGAWSTPLVVPPSTRPGVYPLTARCTTYDGYGGYDGYAGGDSFDYATRSVTVLPPDEPPGSSDGPLTIDPATVPQGGTTRVSGEGFTPGEQVTVTMYSSPEVLARVRADAQGRLSVDVVVPPATPLGAHTVVAMNADSAQNPARTLSGEVTVVAAPPGAPPEEEPVDDDVPEEVQDVRTGARQGGGGGGSGLAFTGGDTLRLVLVALLLMSAGEALRRTRRRRDTT